MADVVPWGRIVLVGAGGRELASWRVVGQGRPDLAVVDALARLQLAARHTGGSIEVREMCPALGELLDLAGLRGEVGGKPEGGEQVGVEEGVEPRDPVA